jgi:hypothetical protein
MQNKICTTCNIEKLTIYYYPRKDGKYGVNSKCKDCCRIYSKGISKELKSKYYLSNKEVIKERSKQIYISKTLERNILRDINKQHKLDNLKKISENRIALKAYKTKLSLLVSNKDNKYNNDRKTYLMKDNHNGLYKIGYSKKPYIREATLQSEKPSIKMVKIWDKNIENKLHKEFAAYRIRGEWFDLNKIQVHYICSNF